MNGTQDVTVDRGETRMIGHSQYYTSGKFPTATLLTVNGEPFLEINNKLYAPCTWCEYGTKSWHGNVFGGVCFQCNGRGFDREIGTVEEAAKLVHRRELARARRDRKAAEKAAEQLAEGDTWRAANADLADMLDAIYAEMAEAGDATTSDAAYYAREAVDARWGEFVTQMANTVGMGRPLTEKQTAAVADAIEKALAAQIAEQARQDAARWYGEEKQRIDATGTVKTAFSVEESNYATGMPEHKMIVIIAGTGEFTGVTFKIKGTGATLWDVEKGQAVTVRGTVKRHGEYDGIKQTELTRAVLKAAE